MNAKLTLATAVIALVVPAIASRPLRDWKNATVLETALTRENLGTSVEGMTIPGYGGYRPSMGMASATMMYRIWQGFTVQDENYTFMVACPIFRRHKPNVTVHGPVKYSMEKGKFYLLDDDGKEFQMVVLEKAAREVKAPK